MDRKVTTRDALLEAALSVFTEHTYAGSIVPMVAERAGVAVGTMYRHFPSKQALGNAVFQQWKGLLLDRLQVPTAGLSTRAEFAHMWAVLGEFATAHPEAFAFLEYQQHGGYLDENSELLSERSNRLAADLVARGQASGEVRAGDPDVLVALAYGAFIGLAKAAWSGLPVGPAEYAAAEEAVWDLLRSDRAPSSRAEQLGDRAQLSRVALD